MTRRVFRRFAFAFLQAILVHGAAAAQPRSITGAGGRSILRRHGAAARRRRFGVPVSNNLPDVPFTAITEHRKTTPFRCCLASLSIRPMPFSPVRA